MAPSREDKKKFIGDLLKAADRYIKAAKYTEAMAEVSKALAVEPGNMYALAYNQRIKSALEALRKKEDEDRVKKITEDKKAAEKSAEPADAPADEPPAQPAGEPAEKIAGPNEDDAYTIRQQQAQIERFKEEIESIRVRHQQEIGLLAAEVQQARAGEKEAANKYRVVVDDAEDSYRRTEELYAEVVRLNERIAQSKQAAEEERTALAAEHRKELLRLESEGERAAAEHRKELLRLEKEGERLAAEAAKASRPSGELDKVNEAHQQELLRLREDLRHAHEELTQAEERMLATATENTALRTALREQESYLSEVTADDTERRRTLGRSLLRTIVDRQLQADDLTPEAGEIMDILRIEIAMSDEDFARLHAEAKQGLYRSALKQAWDEGFITPEQSEKLALLRRKIGISPETHFIIEDELRKEKKSR